MKVLLTNTLRRYQNPSSWRQGKGVDSFNYGLACVAATVEQAGFDVSVLDLVHNGWSEDELEAHIKAQDFDVVGISFFTPQADLAQKTATVVRRAAPDCKVVFGGIHATSVPQETLETMPEVDVCVVGEGDLTFPQLLDCWQNDRSIAEVPGIVYRENGTILTTLPPPQIRDMDALPRPAYHLFPMKEYVVSPNLTRVQPTVSFQVTRGCPHKCTFCDYTTVGGSKIRHKSIPHIIDEIRYLRDEMGFRGMVFRDSTLTIKRKFLVELCEALIKENIDMSWACYSRVDIKDPKELFELMKAAGCWQIGFGCESGNQKTLDLLQKRTTVEQNRDTVTAAYLTGLSVSTTWMLALPGETEEDTLNTIDFALSVPSHIAKFFLPVPYPRTELEHACRADGGLREDLEYINYDLWDQDNPVYVNPLIGKERSVELLKEAYSRYYRNPKMWWRNFKMLRDIEMVKRYYAGVKLLLAG